MERTASEACGSIAHFLSDVSCLWPHLLLSRSRHRGEQKRISLRETRCLVQFGKPRERIREPGEELSSFHRRQFIEPTDMPFSLSVGCVDMTKAGYQDIPTLLEQVRGGLRCQTLALFG